MARTATDSERTRQDERAGANATVGYVAVAAAALLWASSGTAGKALFEGGMTPFELVQVRVTLSSAVLAAAFALGPRRLFRIRARDVGYFAVLGGLGMALTQVTYFYAISKIQVAAAILIQYLAPVLVGIYAVCFWGERLTMAKAMALIIAVGGCYLVAEGYSLQLLQMNRAGVLAGLAAAVCFATYTLLGERGMHRYPPWTVLFYALLFAAVAWHVLHRPFGYLTAGYTGSQWGWIAYISVMGTVVPFGLYFVGINHIRSTRASITATLEPIFAGVLALALLGEALSGPQIVGGVLVICAIVLLQLQREHDSLAPAEIRRQCCQSGRNDAAGQGLSAGRPRRKP